MLSNLSTVDSEHYLQKPPKQRWVECGRGTLRLLVPEKASSVKDGGDASGAGQDKDARCARLVMRREQTKQLILNVPLRSYTQCTPIGTGPDCKMLQLSTMGVDGVQMFLLKFERGSKVASWVQEIEKVRAQ